MLDCEVTLDSVLFDPALRDELTAFFARALHSDYRQRFDNAEEMLRAWRRMFESVDRPTTETDQWLAVDFDHVLAAATEETQLSTLGLSPRLLDALERIGAQTVGQLLNLPRIRLYRNQGLGQKTVREIRGLAERLAQLLPHGESNCLLPRWRSRNRTRRRLTPGCSVSIVWRVGWCPCAPREERRILLVYLGLEATGSGESGWPSRTLPSALPSTARLYSRPCSVLASAGADSPG